MTDPAPPAWTVTQQTEASDIGPAGGYVSGVRITFRTARGVTGSVFVPHDAYSVEGARKAILARAAILDGVADLTG